MASESDPKIPQREPALPEDTPVNVPMTPGLMARLFAVPLVIVSVIVGCAVLVVILFGDIVSEPERSITQLVEILERPTGAKVGGMMLLPQDKESWQAARELAMRLTKPEIELKDEDRSLVITRLGAIIERDAADIPEIVDEKRRDMARQRLGFMMTSLCRTGVREALPFVLSQLDHSDPTVRRDTLFALSYYPNPAHLDDSIGPVTARLKDDVTEVRVVACAAVSNLVSDITRRPIANALADVLIDPQQEVQWNAALTLARIGDSRGKTILLDLLDRDFWEKRVRYQPSDPSAVSQGLEYEMPAGRVNEFLKAAIEAAAHLNEPLLWESIGKLKGDKDPGVCGVALKAVEERQKRNDAG